MTLRRTSLITTLACIGIASSAGLALAAAPTPPDTPHHMHGGPMHGPMPHGAMMFSPFMHALHQLNLTAEQKQSIESIMAAQRDQAKAAMKSAHDNMDALANPGDPSYAAAIAAAKTQAAAEIQKRSDIEVQIYSLLSNEQKTQLPKVIADMKAKHEAHRATHQHGPASTGN